MGWFNRDRPPIKSVIRDEIRSAREEIEFDRLREAYHHLCSLELRDVTVFVDMIVGDINRQYLESGSVGGASLRFPDHLQAVATTTAFQNGFYPILLRAIPEATRDSFTVIEHPDEGRVLQVCFPEIAHQRVARERIAQ